MIKPNTNPFMVIDPLTGLPSYNWQAGIDTPQPEKIRAEGNISGLMGGGSGNSSIVGNGNYHNVSPEAQQRAMASILGELKGIGTGALKKGVMSTVLGGDPLSGLSASSFGGLVTAPVNAAYASYGIEPEGFLGKLISKAPGVIGGLMGGPVVGTAAGVFGPLIADATMDFAGWRDFDESRDKLEDARGEMRGRMDYADAMGNISDKSLLGNDGFNKAAERAMERLETAKKNNMMDQIAALTDQYNAYSKLDGLTRNPGNQRGTYPAPITGPAMAQAILNEKKGGGSGSGGHNVGGEIGSKTGTGGGYNMGGGRVSGL